MDKFLSILGTSAGFLLAIAFWRQTNEGELLTATASALKTTDRPGVFEGMLSIQNTTEVPLRIIGSHNTVCSGSLGISTPVAIAENSKMDVLATLPGIKQGGFATGKIKLILQVNDVAAEKQIAWIGRVDR